MTVAVRDQKPVSDQDAEIERLQDELAAAKRQLSDFIYAASHDLREPVRNIQQFCSLLIEDSGSLPEAMSQYLAVIDASADRALAMIAGLTELSRIRQKPLSLQLIDLDDVLSEAKLLCSSHLEAANATVVADSLPLVPGNRDTAANLIALILDNAVKYRSPERPLVIRAAARPDPQGWELRLSDNGQGFDQADAGRVFEPFQRLVPRSKFPGVGLGLTLCRAMAERMSSEIWATSKVGVGTTIYIKFAPSL